MRLQFWLLTILSFAAGALFSQTRPMLKYPAAPKGDQLDDYHGVKIADPFRSLETAEAESTQKWVEQENTLTATYLAKAQGRDKIRQELTALYDYERFGGFQKAGQRYLYHHNSGLQNQSVVYVAASLRGEGKILLDPNTYRADGTAALAGESISWDGKLFAYGVAQAGSDWTDWRVRDVATGKDLPDLVQWTKGSAVSWTLQGDGFYYSRFPEPRKEELLTAAALHEKVYFHKLGDPQSADKLVFETPEHPTWTTSAMVTDEGRYLLLYIFTGQYGVNLLSYIDPQTGGKPVPVFDTGAAAYSPVAVLGSTLYVSTTDAAPRGRVIAVDLLHPARQNWREIVPQQPETLDDVRIAGGRILVTYLKDAHSTAKLLTLDGKPAGDVALPGLGTASWSGSKVSDQELFYTFASYTSPATLFRLDLTTGTSEVIRQPKLAFDPAKFETTQVFYTSKDGTRVPMFLSHKKGLKLDGNNPAILYGYGGFMVPVTPDFSAGFLEWMQLGGVLAVANLRGGSEYGDAWHEAGMLARKQNVFDDFIAAGEYLIAAKYTSTPKLAIFGGSNGGLLVGAVLNQRPDLFGAAMPAVGVMDMLRFHKFGFGTQWVGEYGSPDNPEDFKTLRAYSPLHNIRKGTSYPAVLVTTSDHDDRVMPGHSLKYAAALQEAQEGPAPILIRIETRAGHGAGKPTSKQIEEWVDRFAFLKLTLGF